MGMVVLASAASYHQQHHHHESLLPSVAAEQNPIIPLLAAAPCIVDDDTAAAGRTKAGGIHLWQSVQFQPQLHLPPTHGANPNPSAALSNYLRKPVPMIDASGILAAGGSLTATGGALTCQDCGNQAKKDCSHRRCRTCCKSREFECSTHVKSTWVPAARRRERQLVATGAGSSASTSAPKRPRLGPSQPATTSHTSTSNTTPARSFDTTSSHQGGNLPGRVQAPAVFKCVRVTSMDEDGEDEYAYHAMVKIGGRVFKGFLYDQGLDDGGGSGGEADNAADGAAIPNFSELHLGNRRGGASSSMPMLPSDVYTAGGGGLIGGTDYGNQIN